MEHDDERDVDFVMVDGVIWEEYGNQAADILRRKKGTKVSVELSISDLSFNSKEKYLEINDFLLLRYHLSWNQSRNWSRD